MIIATKIEPDDIVQVRYPPSEKTSNPAHKLDGQQFVVKRKRVITTRPSNKVYFELYGAESEFGIPYGFLEDELIKV